MSDASSSADDDSEASSSAWVVRVGAWLSPAMFIGLWLAPLPLEANAHRLAAIAGAVLVAWVTEVVPVATTALLIGPALVMTGIMPAKKAFAPYADPILYLFVGSFFAAKAMTLHGLDRRLALGLMGLPGIRSVPGRVRVAMLICAMLLSMWISNTGTTAILLPVLLGVLPRTAGGGHEKSTFAAGSLIALAHASTTGGLATLVGTPPNAITAGILKKAGLEIGFLAWMKVGVPMMLAETALVFLVVKRLLPVEEKARVVASRDRPGPVSRAELVTALSFALAVIGWLAPDLANLAGASWAPELAARLEPGAVALAATSLLFMVPASPGGPRVLSWRDAVHIEWGLIILFGSGIALGEAMFTTGLAKALGDGFLAVTGVSGLWSLTFAMVVIGVVLTEVCSNTAAASMLVPLAIGAAQQLHVSPLPPALAVGIASSCGFMLPVATGPNAIAYGTGLVSTRQMIKIGVWLDALSALVIFTLLRLLCPLLGWT
jgi:sodium-dependent dicarboxylate transporter 2/3/5